jgi:hypothetical protein
MIRPRNETITDIEREEAARTRLEAAWKCLIIPLRPEAYRADWAIFKDQKTFVGWAEYKYRGLSREGQPVKWGKYDSIIISLSKWMTLKHLGEKSHRHFYLFFEWADVMVYGRWPPFTGSGYPIAYGIELGGREDRGQDGDREPVIVIPNNEFKILARA